jgi:hypothetical protein
MFFDGGMLLDEIASELGTDRVTVESWLGGRKP